MKLKEVLKEKKVKIAVPVTLFLVSTIAATSLATVARAGVPNGAEDMANTVNTTTVIKQDLQKTISLNGTITALDSQSVASELTGVKVNALKVRVGDRVKKGDVIAVLDTTSIENSLKQAKDALEIAKKKDALELATAQRNYDSAVEVARIQTERAQREADKADRAYDEAVIAANNASAESTNATNAVGEKTAAENDAKNAVSSANDDVNKTGDKLSSAQSAYDEASQNLTEKEGNVTSLKEDYTNFVNGDLKDAQKRNNDASDALKKANDDLKTAQDNKTALDNDSEATEQQKKEAQDALDKAENDAAVAQGAADEASKTYSELKTKADNLKTKIENAEKSYKKALEKKESREEKLGDAQKANDNAKSNLEAKQNDLTEAQNNLAEAKSKQSEAQSDAESKKESVNTAKENVEKAGESLEDQKREGTKNVADSKDSFSESQLTQGSNSVQAQQEVDKYQQELEKATIVAPCDGLVTAVGVKEGAIYDNGNEIARIQDDSAYKVSATVDQYDICNIKEGLTVKVKTDSVGDEEMEGSLTFVSPIPGSASGQQDSSSQSGSGTGSDYPIEVSIKKGFEDRLRIGMTAKITILEQESKNALTVPDNCVQTAEDGSLFVEKALYDENGNVMATGERITVTYGIKTDYYVEIKGGGLEEGMEILVPSESDGMNEASGQEVIQE